MHIQRVLWQSVVTCNSGLPTQDCMVSHTGKGLHYALVAIGNTMQTIACIQRVSVV